MQAIETIYNGERFRSRLEARWAVFFDTLGVKYLYFRSVGFYLTEWGGHWVEIIESPTSEDKIRAKDQARQSDKLVFQFSDCLPPEIKTILDEEDGSPDVLINNFGCYIAPDGDSDGMQAFGICSICNMVTLGDKGGHWVYCNNRAYEIYQGSCKGWHSGLPLEHDHPRILAAFTAARQARFEEENIHSHKIKRPLIEQAITKERVLYRSRGPNQIHTNDNPKFDFWELLPGSAICIHCYAQEGTQLKSYQAYHHSMLHALEEVHDKYRWTPSATSMIAYLLESGINSGIITLPSKSMWIEIEEPITAVQSVLLDYFATNSNFPPDITEAWALHLFNGIGEEFWNAHIFHTREDSYYFGASAFHICRTGECRPKIDGEITPCESCLHLMEYWIPWIGMAHLILKGTFQEQEETAEIEEVIEKTTRKVPRSDKPHKFTEQAIEHRYRVIRFDACMRKARKQREPQEPRGSWVEATLAINPDAIVYVSRHIGKTERTFYHERFTYKRGQTINVRAHDKRIPMKISLLRKKITRVVASKFENPSD